MSTTSTTPPNVPVSVTVYSDRARGSDEFAGQSSRRRRRPVHPGSALAARGTPMIWLTGGCMVLCLAMILGLLTLVFFQGIGTFWPVPVVQVSTRTGMTYMGEITRGEPFKPGDQVFTALPPDISDAARQQVVANNGWATRRLFRTGNYELTGEHFTWISNFEIAAEGETPPQWAIVFERLEWGRFYGLPVDFRIDDKVEATAPADIWQKFQQHHSQITNRRSQRRDLEKHDIGQLNHTLEQARLDLRAIAMEYGEDSPQYRQQAQQFTQAESLAKQRFDEIRRQISQLNHENDRYTMTLTTASGQSKIMKLADVVRAYPANQLTFSQKISVYLSRWWEFLSDDPREANTEGGVMPAIFGTVVMTLLMTVAVVPFGVLAALYLREYAKAGTIVSAVRIAINNLAGVPSIVFGVFGLGFFCYIVGGTIDQLFFEARMPSPTFGTGGIMWASLTLALLTLPVVIVATEEALSAVPNSMREGSYACGASKWQTIQRIILPRAMPGIMTGTILAMARGAGEVAPLMLVGAVKLAPELPVDSYFPYVHLERSFMHLGFQIYDSGFQSPNSEAAKPMVFTTTLLLIVIIAVLNLTAIALRTRLRRRFTASAF